MRIAHFIASYKPAWVYGGTVSSMAMLCEGLAEQDVDIHVITTNANGATELDVPTDRFVDVDGVSTRYFPRTKVPFGIESLALRKEIDDLVREFDLVHISSVWHTLGTSVAKAAFKAGVPYINTTHGSFNRWMWNDYYSARHRLFWHLLLKKTYKRASAIHFTCDMEVEDFDSLNLGIQNQAFIVPNGLRTRDFAYDENKAAQFRRELGLDEKTKVLLFFGRLHPKKGIDVFLKAAKDELIKHKDWLFLVIGPDQRGYRDELQRLTEELGCAERVRFVPILEGDLRVGAYSAADIFVLTSHNENFGMTVIEAMSAGLPVLISDQVGVSREIARDGAGQVVKMTDESIREGLQSLMGSKRKRDQLSSKGLACAVNRYDLEVIARQMAETYRALLGQTEEAVHWLYTRRG